MAKKVSQTIGIDATGVAVACGNERFFKMWQTCAIKSWQTSGKAAHAPLFYSIDIVKEVRKIVVRTVRDILAKCPRVNDFNYMNLTEII